MAEDEVRIHAATAADVEAMVDLAVAAFGEFAPAVGPARWRGWRADLEATTRENALAAGLVAEMGGRLVGSVLALAREGCVEMRILAVAPDARGLGIGRRLVDAVLARARALSLPEVLLHTTEMMGAAVHLYGSMGFRRDPGADRVVGPGVRLVALRRAV